MDADCEVAADQELCCAAPTATSLQQAPLSQASLPVLMVPGMAPFWTSPCVHPSPHMVATSSLFTISGGPMDGLIEGAMPQAASGGIDREEIAAQLRAALPACYED